MRHFFKILTLCCLGLGIKIQAQVPVEMWTKMSVELRMNIENSPWEFRLRPDDHIFTPTKYVPSGSLSRIDLMIGINFWKFKFFDYSKYDGLGGFWTGPRLDFNFDMLNRKLFVNFQEQFFFGLNEQSEDHFYLIQYIKYAVTNMTYLGVLSYDKWTIEKPFNKGYWFIGPSFEIIDKSGISIQFALTKDIYHEPLYMTYVKLGYRFTLKDRSKPITIED
jgi:hypothetical protein